MVVSTASLYTPGYRLVQLILSLGITFVKLAKDRMFVSRSPITTERLVLRPFRPDDLDDLHAIHSRPDVARYLYWDARRRDEVEEVLQRKIHQTVLAQENDALCLAITRAGAARARTGVIGEISLWWRSLEHRQGEIGFVLHPEHQGKGFAHEAASAMLDLAFHRLRLHRVYGSTDARNTASAALMRRLGMRQEAHFVHNEVFKGKWGDELVFAILEDEWRRGPHV
jgi:RimJ/RimL family protein N-acetyltransferase